jgi:hypothetical protein
MENSWTATVWQGFASATIQHVAPDDVGLVGAELNR